MKQKTKFLIASLLLLGFITYSSSVVMADEQTNYPPFIQTLADKLGVDEEKVATAFDEIRSDQFAQRQQEREERLNQAVEDKVITEEQKLAILDKQSEMEFDREQQRSQHREEMQAWYEEQGIDNDALRDYMGGPRGPHHLKGPISER